MAKWTGSPSSNTSTTQRNTSCLVNCSSGSCKNLRRPVDGETQTPFVIVRFDSGTAEITVGNESAPSFGNDAVIKSFEFGVSNGMQAVIEILDEQGGAFQDWVDRLIKKMDKASKYYKAQIQWGWIVTRCDGTSFADASPICYGAPLGLEVAFAEGKIKYKVTVADLIQMVFVSRENRVIATDDKPVDLQKALIELYEGNEPKMKVKFLRRTPQGLEDTWKFRGDPKSSWAGDNQNKLNTGLKWSEHFPTDRDKGYHALWSTTDKDPTIILMEDVATACNENSGECQLSIGTFIVNGGNCSNVISFSPTINWPAAMARLTVGGNSGTAATGKTEQKIVTLRPCPVQTDNTGITQNIPISRPCWNVHGPDNCPHKANMSQGKYGQAEKNTAGLAGIEAELKVQGMPNMVAMKQLVGREISLVVINPFHLRPAGSNSCGDWLAQPVCNEVLSNRHWTILGVAHSMREGSYVTTFKIKLAQPNIDLRDGDGLGGDGYVPKEWAGK